LIRKAREVLEGLTKHIFSALFFTINGSKFMIGCFLNVVISFALISAATYFFIVASINNLISLRKAPRQRCPLQKSVTIVCVKFQLLRVVALFAPPLSRELI
jgi:large-conductance mechanosensitive channel